MLDKRFTVDGGYLRPARQAPSPNFGDRPDHTRVSLLVLHNISLPPGSFGGDDVERFFTNTLDFDAHPWFDNIRGVQVSAHLFVRRNGEVVQFVDLNKRAWHAGASSYKGRTECNDFSIGIELEGCDDVPYSDAQYETLGGVCACLVEAYPDLSLDNIAGHSDIAPGRKTDPGPAFDWLRFRTLVTQSVNT